MMTKSKTNRHANLKNLALIPFAGMLFLFTCSLNQVYGQTDVKNEKPVVVKAFVDNGQDSLRVYITTNVNSPANSQDVVVETVQSASPDDDVQANNPKGGDIVVVKAVRQTADESQKVIKAEVHTINSKTADNPKILYVIDGVETMDAAKVAQLKPEEIARVDVLKDKDSRQVYTKANVDGVIIIQTKKQQPSPWAGMGNDILYIIDGKEYDNADRINQMNPDDIQKIEIFKKKEEIEKLTDKKVEGVIRVTSK